MKKSRCRYHLCTRGRAPFEIDIYDYRDPYPDVFLTYWVRVFQLLEQLSSVSNLTFYVVWDSKLIRDLPSYGNDVVAVVLQDEYCTIPRYLGRVRFLFKAYGFRPQFERTFQLASLLKQAKEGAIWVAHFSAFARQNGISIPSQGKLVIPLGYARQSDIQGKPFGTRRYLMSFLGSIEQDPVHALSLRGLLSTPKTIARSRMSEALRQLASTIPHDVFLATTGSYSESIVADGARYSEIMADTKICLAPRGSSAETYRFFEAMRQGCVVICNRLPGHWFYDGCPAIQIDDWRDLEACVRPLLAEPDRLLALHRESLAWWESKCSERAVAETIARCLEGAKLRSRAQITVNS